MSIEQKMLERIPWAFPDGLDNRKIAELVEREGCAYFNQWSRATGVTFEYLGFSKWQVVYA